MSFLTSLWGIFGEVSSVSDPNAWFLRKAAGSPTHAGTTVNEHTAFELPVVYAAIGILSDGEAQLPMDIIRKRGERREPVEDHPLAQALNLRANRWMTAFTVRNLLMSHAVGWGNGYAEIQRDGAGRVVGLWPLLPDRTFPRIDPETGELRIVTHTGGERVSLPHEHVLHIPAMGFDGLCGYSPLYMARQAIGLGKALEEHGGKFFANEARSGGFIEYPGKLGPVAMKNLSESVQMQGGLENAQRVKILEEGAKFHPVTIPPDDAQFLQTRQYQVEEIARFYRIPLNMLQSHSKDTAWGTGISEMNQGFLTHTLEPWLDRCEQEMTWKLLSESERADGLFIRHNVGSLLRGAPSSRAQFYTAALDPSTGWMERDEVRALEDLNPLGDDQDEAGEELVRAAPEGRPLEMLG